MYTKQDILNLVEEEDVQFIRLQFTDLSGQIKNVAITVSQLEKALENKITFDGSAFDGFVSVEESDMYLYPILDTFAIFPWRPHQGKVARLICDIYTADRKPFAGDPRYILKKVMLEAYEMGFDCQVGPECEFYLFNTDDSGAPLASTNDEGGYFDVAPLDNGENCRREIVLTLEDMDFEVEASHHESGRGQHEVVFGKDSALVTADRITTFKMVVKTIAKRHGLHATFMPKPLQTEDGSALHLNFSLLQNGKNIFAENGVLSDTAKSFIAGMLAHAREISCLTNPTVNSYKRFLMQEKNCVNYLAWSEKNRSLAIRVPSDLENSARIEYRVPDLTCNPYFALAACIKAGLDGIRQGMQPPERVDHNPSVLSEEERREEGIDSMPYSLIEAIDTAKDSIFVRELLGDALHARYLDAKQREYEDYCRQITQWELSRYLIRY